MTADQLMMGIVADLGGESELTTLQRSYIRRLGDVEITIRLLASDIATRGLLTPAGGVRNVYGAFLAGIDRFDKLAQRIGLKRGERPIPTVRQYLDGAEVPEP
jgi:hypothetical protein